MNLDATTAEFLKLLYPTGVTPGQYPALLERLRTFEKWRGETARATASVIADAPRVCAVPGCPKTLRGDNASGLCQKHNKNASVFQALLAKSREPKSDPEAESPGTSGTIPPSTLRSKANGANGCGRGSHG